MLDHATALNNLIRVSATDLTDVGFKELEKPENLTTVKNSNVFFTSSVLGMQAVSHVIEDQALTIGGSHKLYSGFQKFSRAQQQQERYQMILKNQNPIYLFGVPDTELWYDPYLKPVPLPASNDLSKPDLSQNWFVILHNPKFVSMALVSRELPSPNRPANAADKLVYRRFEGFWTYDLGIIGQVVAILDDYLESHQLN
jgi:DICT domain-containing protein